MELNGGVQPILIPAHATTNPIYQETMNITKTTLLSALIGLFASRAMAEVEFQIHGKDGVICEMRGWDLSKDAPPPGFPILISLADKNGNPIRNAIVVLKRLGPDGWTEDELKREKDSITDKNGMVVITYPDSTQTIDKSGQSRVLIYGAVTVIAEGHRTVTIELKDHFKDGICILTPDSAPHLKLALQDARPSGIEQEAEQSADGKTPIAPQPPR